MAKERAPWYRAVVQSLSAQVECTLSDAEERTLFELTLAMRPFRLWVVRAGGGVEVVDCCPGLPGFRYSVRPANAIPVRADGTAANPADNEKPASFVEPTDARYAALVLKSQIKPIGAVGLVDLLALFGRVAPMLAVGLADAEKDFAEHLRKRSMPPEEHEVEDDAVPETAPTQAAPAKPAARGAKPGKKINGHVPTPAAPVGHASIPDA